MNIQAGSYWDAQHGPAPTRYRVCRIIPGDDGPYVAAVNLATGDLVVERADRWIGSYTAVLAVA